MNDRQQHEQCQYQAENEPTQLVQMPLDKSKTIAELSHRVSFDSSTIGDDTDRLRHLYAGAFTQAAADTSVQNFRLLQHPYAESQIGQRAGSITHTAGLALVGQAEAFVDMGSPHLHVFSDRLGRARN
jgi:hypothetical protein